jgi:hypothetical protein
MPVRWLARLLGPRIDPKQVRNDGLGLAMDWGDEWLSPIQARLGQRYPALAAPELDQINEECQAAMRLGHETVYAFVRDGTPAPSPQSLEPILRAAYPWVDDDNVRRLFTQSLYYATKAGGPARKA